MKMKIDDLKIKDFLEKRVEEIFSGCNLHFLARLGFLLNFSLDRLCLFGYLLNLLLEKKMADNLVVKQ